MTQVLRLSWELIWQQQPLICIPVSRFGCSRVTAWGIKGIESLNYDLVKSIVHACFPHLLVPNVVAVIDT